MEPSVAASPKKLSLNPKRPKALGQKTSALSPLKASRGGSGGPSSAAAYPVDTEYQRGFGGTGGASPHIMAPGLDDKRPKGFGNLSTQPLWIPVGKEKPLSTTTGTSFPGAVPPPALPRSIPKYEPSTLRFHGTTVQQETLDPTAAIAYEIVQQRAAESSGATSLSARGQRPGSAAGSKVFPSAAAHLPLSSDTENRTRFDAAALYEAAQRVALEQAKARREQEKKKEKNTPTLATGSAEETVGSPSQSPAKLFFGVTHNMESFGGLHGHAGGKENEGGGESALSPFFAKATAANGVASSMGTKPAARKNAGVQCPSLTLTSPPHAHAHAHLEAAVGAGSSTGTAEFAKPPFSPLLPPHVAGSGANENVSARLIAGEQEAVGFRVTQPLTSTSGLLDASSSSSFSGIGGGSRAAAKSKGAGTSAVLGSAGVTSYKHTTSNYNDLRGLGQDPRKLMELLGME